MADNVIVSNAPTSVNTDIPVRTIDKSGEQVQVVVVDYGGSGAENLTTPDFATETTLQSIDTTLQEGIVVNPVHDDILGVAVSGTRNNQLEISFDTSFNNDLITNTDTGTGGATITNGHALYSTGTGTTSSSKGVSVATLSYRPAHEEYAYFTAAFTTPTSANSNQRIGLYDSDNGFFVGYNGTNFGLTKRVATVDTFTNRTSWNGDLLTGAAGSKFTRNGTPEAINLTYSNLFRIRFAWLGSASVLFEVFSPDGSWVVFHTLKFPNSQLNPSINSPNLPITIEVNKTSADSTNLILYTACVAAGTTSNYSKITDTLTDYTLANLTRSVIAGRASTGGGTYYNVKVTPSGSLTVALGDISGIVGQDTMANSVPVVIASDQSAVPISDNGGSITVDGTVTANQGGTWNINNISGTISLPTGAATSANQSTQITSLQLLDDVVATDGSAALTKLYQVGGTDGTNAQIMSTNASGHVNIADGGNSITVDGTVAATQSGTWNINNITGTVSLPTGAATETTLAAINTKTPSLGQTTMTGSVPVTIASNQTAIPITDNSGSITVDGTVTANQGGTWNITNITGTVSLPTGAATETTLSSLNGKVTACNTGAVTIAALPNEGQQTMANSISVAVASDQSTIRTQGPIAAGTAIGANGLYPIAFTDLFGNAIVPTGINAGGINVLGTVPLDTSARIQQFTASGEVYVTSLVANDAVDSGNPIKVGMVAATTFPTAVASGDRVNANADRFGRQLVTNIDYGQQVWKSGAYTTTQTGVALWTPAAGKKITVTYLAVSSYGTTTGRVYVWFGASGDTTYTAGTDQLVWAGSFTPNAYSNPGAIVSLPFGVSSANADYILRLTSTAAVSLEVTVYGYED